MSNDYNKITKSTQIVVFDRYGQSCNNLIDDMVSALKKLPTSKTCEPTLSLYGILSILGTNKNLVVVEDNNITTGNIKEDNMVIFVSCLVRTWMTAILKYLPHCGNSNFTLVISPYLKEKHGNFFRCGNMPAPDIQSQIKKIDNFFSYLQHIVNNLETLKNSQIYGLSDSEKEIWEQIHTRLKGIIKKQMSIKFKFALFEDQVFDLASSNNISYNTIKGGVFSIRSFFGRKPVASKKTMELLYPPEDKEETEEKYQPPSKTTLPLFPLQKDRTNFFPTAFSVFPPPEDPIMKVQYYESDKNPTEENSGSATRNYMKNDDDDDDDDVVDINGAWEELNRPNDGWVQHDKVEADKKYFQALRTRKTQKQSLAKSKSDIDYLSNSIKNISNENQQGNLNTIVKISGHQTQHVEFDILPNNTNYLTYYNNGILLFMRWLNRYFSKNTRPRVIYVVTHSELMNALLDEVKTKLNISYFEEIKDNIKDTNVCNLIIPFRKGNNYFNELYYSTGLKPIKTKFYDDFDYNYITCKPIIGTIKIKRGGKHKKTHKRKTKKNKKRNKNKTRR